MGETDHPTGDEARQAALDDSPMATGFVAELRRRGVLRAVLGYAFVAFAVLQVVEPVLHGLRLPDWTLTAVVIALAAGFPLTIVVSWAFDLTIRGFERATPSTSRLPHASRWPLLAMTFGGVVLGALGSWLVLRNEGRAAAGPDGRVVVAVADFANETRDPELDGLSEILVGWLEQSRTLRVLTRGRLVELLHQMGQDKTGRIDEQMARAVGRRAGVRVLLLASIRQIGGNYAVELRAVDPEKDDYLFAVPEHAKAKSDLFPLIERLSDRVRERIRERPAEVEAAKIKVDPLTSNFEAWERYFRGIREEEAFHFPEALQNYREAVRADPHFALAHYRIAYRGEFLGLPPSDLDLAMRSALANVHSLPVKERLLVYAWKAHIDGWDDEAQAIYRRAIDAFPDDKDVLFLAGDLHFHAQQWEEALPLLRKVSALAPRWDLARDHLSACLSTLGLFDELQEVARSWVEKMPTPVAFANLSDALGQAGRVEESIAAGRRATEMDDRLFSRASWGLALVLAERYEEAEAVFRPLFNHGRADDPGFEGRILLSSALRYQGRHQEALTVIESSPPDSDGIANSAALPC
jgi:tetratricopeptide (TPR) repeat protein